jgi:hypothetical protein
VFGLFPILNFAFINMFVHSSTILFFFVVLLVDFLRITVKYLTFFSFTIHHILHYCKVKYFGLYAVYLFLSYHLKA